MVEQGLSWNENPMTSLLQLRAQEPDPIATALHRVEPNDLIELGTSVEPFTRPETFIVQDVATSERSQTAATDDSKSVSTSASVTHRAKQISLYGPHDDQYIIDLSDDAPLTPQYRPELVAQPDTSSNGRTARRATNYGPIEFLVLDT